MSIPLYIHGLSDVGRQRERNEDTFRIDRRGSEGAVLLVCDGMGGHGGGDIASQWAADFIMERLPAPPLAQPPQTIREALEEANVVVLDRAETSRDPAMGTTAVLAWIEGSRCWCGWVGDSRLYRFRDGARLNRTVDHTRVQRLVELKVLTVEDARHHPDAHILTQAIGGGDDRNIRPSVLQQPMELVEGDVLLLCSDGLYDMIEDEELYPLIRGLHYQEAVERLIAEANARGGQDNITVIVCVAGSPTVPLSAGSSDDADLHTTPPPDTFEDFVPHSAAPAAPSARSAAPPPPPPRGSGMRRRLLLFLPILAVVLVVAVMAAVGVGSAGWHLFQQEDGSEEAAPPPPEPPPVDPEEEARALEAPPPPPPPSDVPLDAPPSPEGAGTPDTASDHP